MAWYRGPRNVTKTTDNDAGNNNKYNVSRAGSGSTHAARWQRKQWKTRPSARQFLQRRGLRSKKPYDKHIAQSNDITLTNILLATGVADVVNDAWRHTCSVGAAADTQGNTSPSRPNRRMWRVMIWGMPQRTADTTGACAKLLIGCC